MANKKKENSKVGAVIILIISAVVFLPFGGAAVYQGLFNKNHAPVFGSYGHTKITYEPNSKLQKNTRNLVNNYKRAGYDVNDQMYGYVLYQAFQQTLYATHFEKEVKKSGWKVSESSVKRELINYYSDANGTFYSDLYKQAKDSDIQELTEEFTDSLTYSRYTDDVFGSQETFNGQQLYGLKSNTVEEDFINKMGAQRKSFQIASFNTNEVPSSITKSYIEENGSKFDRYPLMAVTVEDQKEAKKLYKDLQMEKISFDDAVDQKSERTYTDYYGNVTLCYDYQMPDMIENEKDLQKVKALGLDEISPVIKTRTGYTIYKLVNEVEKADASNAKLMAEVESYIAQNEKGLVEEYYIALADSLKAKAAEVSMNAAAKQFGATVLTADNCALNAASSSLMPESSDALKTANENVYKMLFKLSENEISEPIVNNSQVIVAKCVKDSTVNSNNATSAKIKEADETSAETTFKENGKITDKFYEGYQQLMGN